jgi:hypothetical protein
MNPNQMYYLIYTSQTRHSWDDAALIELLKRSIELNAENEITGMLVFLQDRFIQLLEGTEAQVKSTFGRIVNDKRHEKVRIILQGELEKRIFSGWSMGFKTLQNDEFLKYGGFRSIDVFFENDQITDHSHPALIFLKLFYQKNSRDMENAQNL